MQLENSNGDYCLFIQHFIPWKQQMQMGILSAVASARKYMLWRSFWRSIRLQYWRETIKEWRRFSIPFCKRSFWYEIDSWRLMFIILRWIPARAGFYWYCFVVLCPLGLVVSVVLSFAKLALALLRYWFLHTVDGNLGFFHFGSGVETWLTQFHWYFMEWTSPRASILTFCICFYLVYPLRF